LVFGLPFARFSIDTNLSHAETRNRLVAAVETRRFTFWSKSERPFLGRVEMNEFRIRRNINYRNSFLPIIRGCIQAQERGSRVQGTMRPHALVLAFLVFWCAGVVVIGGAVSFAMLAESGRRADALLPVGMLLFAWLLTSIGFTFEARKAERVLRELVSTPALSSLAKPHN